MEVTNSNANSFAPKLGSVSSQTFGSDAFSTHLRENQSETHARTDDRNATADRHSARAERAETAEAAAEAAEEQRAARARDRDEGRSEQADRDAPADDTAEEVVEVAASLPIIDEAADDTGEDTHLFSEAVDASLEDEPSQDLAQSDTAEITDDQDTTTKLSDLVSGTSSTRESTTGTVALASVETDATTSNIVETSEDLIIDQVRTTNAATIAVTEASSNNRATTPTVQPTVQRASTGSQNAAQETASASEGSDKAADLSNLADENFEGDADAKGDGEKSLGQQAAESLAGKNKPGQTSPVTATTAAQTATPTLPTAPLQALAALGLNTTNLTANFDLELLGLTPNGQVGTTGSPQNANPLLVRFGALPGQAQATQVPNTAIALQIAKHVAKGVSTFKIRLDPPEMGRIDIKLELAQDGRVTAHLAIEKSDTLDLMQRDSKALEQALRDAGLDVDSDTLNFSLQSGNEGTGTDLDQSANSSQAETEQEDAQQANIVTALAARQLEAAARGGIDVSI